MLKRTFIFSLAFLLACIAPATVARAQGAAALKLPAYKKVRLKNGLTLLLMEQHEVPIISFNFIVKAGSVADPAGKEGVASLTAGLLRKGTKTRTADQIANELDFVGGTLGAFATFDYTQGTAEFVRKDIAKGLELLSDVLLNPTFPQAETTKMQAQRVDAVKAAKDEASGVIGTYYNAYLFGSHPYGRPTEGDEKTIAAITREDVAKFYQTYYTPSNTILAVAGDFQTAEMERMLTERFGAWPDKTAPAITLTEAAPVQGKRLLLIDKPDSTQTFYRIGNIGIPRTSADRVQIEVVNTLFGGRFTSMLNSALRINTGLTYGARSAFDQRRLRGPFFINTYTRNETTGQAIDMTLDILKRLHEKGITEEELKSAKSYLKGQFPPRIETTDQLAALIAQLEFFGLDERDINTYYARIDAMTLDDARRVIKQYFPAENLVFVLIGKASEIEPVIRKYAPNVEKKSITQVGF
ncbi:MAG TPA: pitrilysin family protein [Pyrinomonadaceae bacterium]|nr:pitrilysin family protein [Pyrinomonadaceae bacterium]